MLACLCAKANSKEIVNKYYFPLISEKNADVSIFVRLKANYLETMRSYPYFSSWIPIALAKTYFFRIALIWRKNLCIK